MYASAVDFIGPSVANMRQHQSVGKNQLPNFIREASLFELEIVIIVVVNV